MMTRPGLKPVPVHGLSVGREMPVVPVTLVGIGTLQHQMGAVIYTPCVDITGSKCLRVFYLGGS